MSLALAPLDPRVESAAELPCRKFDPDLWFSDSPAQLELAKSLCGDCPLRAECLAGAVERAEPWGVWGGETGVRRADADDPALAGGGGRLLLQVDQHRAPPHVVGVGHIPITRSGR